MYDRQANNTDNKEYLAEIRNILKKRPSDVNSSQLVVEINKVHKKQFGPLPIFNEIKKEYNDLDLAMEGDLSYKIQSSKDPRNIKL